MDQRYQRAAERERLCDAFEAAWARKERPEIESCLKEAPAEEAGSLLRDLLELELDYRVEEGEAPALDEYLARFPDFPEEVRASFAAVIPPSDASAKSISEERYALGEMLARGGLGAIHEAEDTRLRRQVAIKVLRTGARATAPQQARFLQEAVITGQLEHPGIVPVHELDRDREGRVFYAMKLVKGRDLGVILEGVRKCDPATVEAFRLNRLARIFSSVCDAIGFAHSRGVVHRDLKPANIMVGEFGEVLVMDWGLAKVLREDGAGEEAPATSEFDLPAVQTMEGAILGTPHFMAPEQAEGRTADVDERSDVYALGGVLYQMLTLVPPVSGTTLEELLRKIQTSDIRPPTSFTEATARGRPRFGQAYPHLPGGRVPEALASVAMKALSRRREDRYQTVAAMQADVEAWLGGFATSAEQAGPWRLLKLFLRRHRAAASVAAAAAVALSAVGVYSYVVNLQARRAAEKNYEDLIAEQARRREERRGAAPALIRVARGLSQESKFEDAQRVAETAAEYQPELTEAHLLVATLNARAGRFQEAAARCATAEKLPGASPEVAELRRLCERAAADPNDDTRPLPDIVSALGRVGFPEVAAFFADSVNEKLRLYRRTIERAWPRLGGDVDPAGKAVDGLSWMRDKGLHFQNLQAWERNEADRGKYLDLSPLKGIPLHGLTLGNLPIVDLKPLRGMATLRELTLVDTEVADLSPLQGLKLERLNLAYSKTSDLSPLRGMPLKWLSLRFCESVSDLSPLADMPLESLSITGTKVGDLSSLRGLPLRDLELDTKPTDFSVLASLPLRRLSLSANDKFPPPDLTFLTKLSLEEMEFGTDFRSKQLQWTVEAPDLSLFRPNTLRKLSLPCDEVVLAAPLLAQGRLTEFSAPANKLHFLSPEFLRRYAMEDWAGAMKEGMRLETGTAAIAGLQPYATHARHLAREVEKAKSGGQGDWLSRPFVAGGRRYVVVKVPAGWEQAKGFAEQAGGKLAVIAGKEEWDALAAWLEDAGANGRVYLGGRLTGTEGRLEWVTKEPANFTKWAPGQPSIRDASRRFVAVQKGAWGAADGYRAWWLVEWEKP